MGIQQVTPWKLWPSGDNWPIAVLPFNIAELSNRYGLQWQTGIDDLGRFHRAAIELSTGHQAWLVRYDDDPNPGTVVQVDAESDIAESLACLLEVLAITREKLLWEAPAPWNEPLARFG